MLRICVILYSQMDINFLKSPKIAKIAKAGNAKKKLLYKSLIDYIEKKKYHLRSLKLGYSK